MKTIRYFIRTLIWRIPLASILIVFLPLILIPIHELGHVVIALYYNQTIVDVVWLSITDTGEFIGYVITTGNPSNPIELDTVNIIYHILWDSYIDPLARFIIYFIIVHQLIVKKALELF